MMIKTYLLVLLGTAVIGHANANTSHQKRISDVPDLMTSDGKSADGSIACKERLSESSIVEKQI
jgi:hypothetical protein